MDTCTHALQLSDRSAFDRCGRTRFCNCSWSLSQGGWRPMLLPQVRSFGALASRNSWLLSIMRQIRDTVRTAAVLSVPIVCFVMIVASTADLTR